MAICYIKDMLLHMMISLPIIITVRFIFYQIKLKNLKINIFHEIGIIIFILFLIGLISQTVKPDFNIASKNSDINLIPFKVFKQTYHTIFVDHYLDYFLINFVGNIIIFMPIGFFVPLLWTKKHIMLKTVFLGFAISLLIEISQLFLPRRTDIDDLWLNTLGTLIGYLVFYIINKKFLNFIAKFKLNILK